MKTARPGTDAVISRILCLYVMIARANFEAVSRDKNVEKGLVKRLNSELSRWARKNGLDKAFSRMEATMFEKPFGRWGREEIMYGYQAGESMGILLWAARKIDAVSPYDSCVPISAFLDNFQNRTAVDLRKVKRLRGPKELQAACKTGFCWVWRGRTMDRMNRVLLEGKTTRQILAGAARAFHREGSIPRPVGGDFPFRGKPYHKARPTQRRRARFIAEARYHALMWLCGNTLDPSDGTTCPRPGMHSAWNWDNVCLDT